MKGLFVVCEGLDCGGKTTTIKNVMKQINKNKFIYSKGLGSNTIVGKIARKLPSTFMFLVELIYLTYKNIFPKLLRGKIVLQDRYDMSVISFVPSTEKLYNRMLIQLLKSLLIKPDILIHFTVDMKNRLKRLKKSSNNNYHKMLIENPSLIIMREKSYTKLFDELKCKKIEINTSKYTIKEATQLLINLF